MALSWDDLRVVLALDRSGSLTATARALEIDRTTAARRLAALEAALGTRLVSRRAGGLAPTAAARALAKRAAEMEALAVAAEREVAGREGRIAGTVRVSATEALAGHVLARPLAALCARNPGLLVELQVEPRAVSLARGEADVAVRLLPPAEPTTAGRRVGTVGYGAYVQRGRAAEARRGRCGLLLWSEPIPGAETEWLLRRFPGAPVVLRTGSTGALAAAAAGGAGVAVLPCFVGDGDRGLVRLDAPGELPSSEIWVLVHRDQRRAGRVAAVRAEIERVLMAARAALEGRGAGRASPASPRRRSGKAERYVT